MFRKLLRHWPVVVAVLYFLGGVAAWAQFAAFGSDGLGNLGLIVYVMPISIVGFGLGKLLGAKDFLFVPHGLDLTTASAIYFFPSLVLLTILVGWILPAWFRRAMQD